MSGKSSKSMHSSVQNVNISLEKWQVDVPGKREFPDPWKP